MNTLSVKDINVSGNDPMYGLLNKICFACKKDGKSFVAKLVEIHGNRLYFETKNGNVVMNDISNIAEISERVCSEVD